MAGFEWEEIVHMQYEKTEVFYCFCSDLLTSDSKAICRRLKYSCRPHGSSKGWCGCKEPIPAPCRSLHQWSKEAFHNCHCIAKPFLLHLSDSRWSGLQHGCSCCTCGISLVVVRPPVSPGLPSRSSCCSQTDVVLQKIHHLKPSPPWLTLQWMQLYKILLSWAGQHTAELHWSAYYSTPKYTTIQW